jgi:hypothetical protein
VSDFLVQLRGRVPFVLAVAATTLWLLALILYVRALGGLSSLAALPPHDLAVLIAGGAAPSAALWLIMAVFEQRRALSIFGRRMGEMMAQTRQSLQQAESQARTLMQLQAQAARTQAMETRRFALQDMAASVAVLAERLGVMNREAVNEAWARYGAGDVNVFVQSFLTFAVSHPDIDTRMAEAVVEDAVAAAALAAFVRRYERLAASFADDKLAAEIFDDGALGRAFRLFKSADQQAAKLLTPHGAPQTIPDDETLRQDLASLSARLDAAAPAGP